MVQCYSHFQKVKRYHSQLFLGDILFPLNRSFICKKHQLHYLLNVHILIHILSTNAANVGADIYLRLFSSMQRM